MKITKQLITAFGIAVLFLLMHILLASFKWSELLNLIITLGLMVSTQLFAFFMLKRRYENTRPSFKSMWIMLGLTQFFSIILLTLNAAFNPLIKNPPIHYKDVLISLLIFAFLFPLLITTIIWIIYKRKENEKKRIIF